MDRFRCVARQNCVTQHEAGATEKGVGQDLRTSAPGPKRGTAPKKARSASTGTRQCGPWRAERGKAGPQNTARGDPQKGTQVPRRSFVFFRKLCAEKKKQIHFLKEFKLQMDLFLFRRFRARNARKRRASRKQLLAKISGRLGRNAENEVENKPFFKVFFRPLERVQRPFSAPRPSGGEAWSLKPASTRNGRPESTHTPARSRLGHEFLMPRAPLPSLHSTPGFRAA